MKRTAGPFKEAKDRADLKTNLQTHHNLSDSSTKNGFHQELGGPIQDRALKGVSLFKSFAPNPHVTFY